jgi:DUF1365 family protein
MLSRLYECSVLHARRSPRAHRFSYRLFFLAIDLDELPTLARKLKLLRIDRPGLLSLHQRDYLPLGETAFNSSAETPARSTAADSTSIKDRVRALLESRQINLPDDARVLLLTLPRMVGYQFNPVSFFFVSSSAGAPLAAIAEVTNTFRETKPFVLGPETLQTEPGLGPAFRLRVPKFFYVSPFSDVDVEFDFRLHPPGRRLVLQIDDYEGARRSLVSTVTSRGEPRAMSDRALAWFSLKYPFVTLGVICAIHWEALRLWWKRVPWYAKAARAQDQRDLRRPHGSLLKTTAPAITSARAP